jgi:hypothetical protein
MKLFARRSFRSIQSPAGFLPPSISTNSLRYYVRTSQYGNSNVMFSRSRVTPVEIGQKQKVDFNTGLKYEIQNTGGENVAGKYLARLFHDPFRRRRCRGRVVFAFV